MKKLEHTDLLNAGIHFGHLTRKWNPAMAPYIFMEKNGIHIIDLHKTLICLDEACGAIKAIARSGKRIMFVATKKQAQEVVETEAQKLKMPYVTERWLGGMLTNFATIRKSLKKMSSLEKMMKEEAFQNLAKRERLMMIREKDKLRKVLGGIAELNSLPSALFVIDIKKEHIAIAEAQKLNIPVFGLVDTNSDPNKIDFPIPGNDDSLKAIQLITQYVSAAIQDGHAEHKKNKEEQAMARAKVVKKQKIGNKKWQSNQKPLTRK